MPAVPALRRVVTLSKGVGVDARYGIDIFAARSVGQTRFRNGLRSSSSLTDVASVTRATTAWGIDQAGVLSSFAAGQPVVNTAGLAVYEARTNSVRNPTGLGAVAGTPGTAPTNWSIVPAGLSRQVVGVGTEKGLPYVDLRLFGTNSTGGNIYPDFRFEATSYIAAVVGQTWVSEFSARIAAGSDTGITLAFGFQEANAGGSWLGTNAQALSGLSSELKKFRMSAATAQAMVAFVSPRITGTVANGASVDLTLRIAAPNLKLGADINDPPILQTNNAAATRNADVITEAVNIPVGQPFTVTGKFVAPPLNPGKHPYVFEMRSLNGQSMLMLHFEGTGNLLYCVASTAGSGPTYNSGSTWTAQSPGSVVGFAITFDGSSIKWSVNGGADKTVSIPNGPFDAPLATLALASQVNTQGQLNAPLRDLAITMRAFSSAERQAASDVTLTHDLDFVSQVYQYVGSPYVTPNDLPMTTFSRGSAATATAADGTVLDFASGALRITEAGALFEASSTTLVPNSRFQDWTGALPNGYAVGAELGQYAKVPGVYGSNALKIIGPRPNDVNRVNGTISGINPTTAYTLTARLRKTRASGASAHLAYGVDGWSGSAFVLDITSAPLGVWVTRSVTDTSSAAPMASGGLHTNNTNCDVEVDWYQIEQGSVSSSLIKNDGGSSATRAADLLVSTQDPNPSAYTILAEFTVPLTGPAYSQVWHYDDGTDQNRTTLYYDRVNGRIYGLVTTSNATQALLNLGSVTPGQAYKAAVAVAANDFAGVMTGGSVQTDAAGSVPSTTSFRIGHAVYQFNFLGSPIKRIRRWNVRKSNSELQALVA